MCEAADRHRGVTHKGFVVNWMLLLLLLLLLLMMMMMMMMMNNNGPSDGPYISVAM
jgi:hypothetical protein